MDLTTTRNPFRLVGIMQPRRGLLASCDYLSSLCGLFCASVKEFSG
jgi:hypothetical protein